MPIEVKYEGLTLAQGTKLVATPQGAFVEMPAPMPVGTRLQLDGDGRSVAVRVARVHEGVGPGVFVVPLAGGALLPSAPEPAPTAAVEAPELTTPTAAPGSPAATSAPPEAETGRVVEPAPTPPSVEAAPAATMVIESTTTRVSDTTIEMVVDAEPGPEPTEVPSEQTAKGGKKRGRGKRGGR